MARAREKVVQSAEKLVAKGKIEAGIKEYKKLLDDSPNDISTLNRVGDLYARISQNDRAIELFTKIAERYTDDGFFVKAIAIYKKIIKLDPTLLAVYERLAELYHRQGLVNEARTQYQVLADYYQKHEDRAAAIGIYRRMVDLEPDNPSHHAKLAELYQEEDLLDKALEEYRTIAVHMLDHGHGEQAAQVFERALHVSADDLDFVRDAVQRLRDGDHTAAAARVLATATRLNPDAGSLAGSIEPAETPAEPEPEAEAAAETAPVEEPAGAPTSVADHEPDPEAVAEFESALEELDLDDDDLAGQVQPPPDMEGRRGAAWTREGEEADGDDTASTAPGIEAAVPDEGEEADPEATMAPIGAAGAAGTAEDDENDLDLDASYVFELDLEVDDEALVAEAEAVGSSIEATGTADPSLGEDDGLDHDGLDHDGLDHDFLERTAAEVTPNRPLQVEDLLTEAEVLLKYGIHEKALERLAELLQRDPNNLTGYGLMVSIHLDAERPSRAAQVATRMAEVAERLGDVEAWSETRGRLLEAGFDVRGTTVVAPGEEDPASGAGEAFSLDLDEDDVDEEASIELDLDAELDAEEPVDLQAAADAAALQVDTGGAVEPDVDFDLDLDAESEELTFDVDLAEDLDVDESAVDEPAVDEPTVAARDATAPDLGIEEVEDIDAEDIDTEDIDAEDEEFVLAPETDEAELDVDLEVELDAPGDGALEDGALADDVVEDDADALFADAPAPPPVDEAVPSPPPPLAPRRPRRRAADDPSAALAALEADVLGGKSRRRHRPPAREAEAPAPRESITPEEMAPEIAASDAPAAAPSAPASPAGGLDPLQALGASLRDEIESGDTTLPESRPVETQGPGAPPPSAPSRAAVDLDDSGTSWLDEVSSETTDGDALFDEEEDFFDLGAELEQELSDEDTDLLDDMLETNREQTLEEIVEGFKQGVAENLSAEDYETHFNLGIAYREMGLLDEAIGEFQLAAKAQGYLGSCASMLGLCFVEKGLPELAIKWYRRGLAADDIPEEDRLGLLYDLGSLHAEQGDLDEAYEIFVDIYGTNTNYRDVVARLAELDPKRRG